MEGNNNWEYKKCNNVSAEQELGCKSSLFLFTHFLAEASWLLHCCVPIFGPGHKIIKHKLQKTRCWVVNVLKYKTDQTDF